MIPGENIKIVNALSSIIETVILENDEVPDTVKIGNYIHNTLGILNENWVPLAVLPLTCVWYNPLILKDNVEIGRVCEEWNSNVSKYASAYPFPPFNQNDQELFNNFTGISTIRIEDFPSYESTLAKFKDPTSLQAKKAACFMFYNGNDITKVAFENCWNQEWTEQYYDSHNQTKPAESIFSI